jgi:hypothetical protein
MRDGDDNITIHQIIQSDLDIFDGLLVRILANHDGFETVFHLALPDSDCCQTRGNGAATQQESQSFGDVKLDNLQPSSQALR